MALTDSTLATQTNVMHQRMILTTHVRTYSTYVRVFHCGTHGWVEGVKAIVDGRPPYLVEGVNTASVEGHIRPVADFTDEICKEKGEAERGRGGMREGGKGKGRDQ